MGTGFYRARMSPTKLIQLRRAFESTIERAVALAVKTVCSFGVARELLDGVLGQT